MLIDCEIMVQYVALSYAITKKYLLQLIISRLKKYVGFISFFDQINIY